MDHVLDALDYGAIAIPFLVGIAVWTRVARNGFLAYGIGLIVAGFSLAVIFVVQHGFSPEWRLAHRAWKALEVDRAIVLTTEESTSPDQLRPGSVEDLLAWAEGARAAGRPTGALSVFEMQPILIVDHKVAVPEQALREGVVLLVQRGVSRPKGDLGPSHVLMMDGFRCIGPLCARNETR